MSLGSLGEHEKAVECFDAAIRLEPVNDMAYYGKGVALYYMGRYRDAVECFDKSLGINPGDGNAAHYRTESLRALKTGRV